MNFAILLSGGTGTRIGGDIPKQYIRAGGRMMITWALKPLLHFQQIDSVVIVAAPSWRKVILLDAERNGLETEKIIGFSEPGETRQHSILNGLESVRTYREKYLSEQKSQEDTAIIHDAARPFLSESLLDACYAALPGHDGVMPVLPMKDTLYLSYRGTRADERLDRRRIFAGQAPELFLLAPYYRANKKLTPDDFFGISGATEPALLAGLNVAIIPGEERNRKVTTQTDVMHFVRQMEGAYT